MDLRWAVLDTLGPLPPGPASDLWCSWHVYNSILRFTLNTLEESELNPPGLRAAMRNPIEEARLCEGPDYYVDVYSKGAPL